MVFSFEGEFKECRYLVTKEKGKDATPVNLKMVAINCAIFLSVWSVYWLAGKLFGSGKPGPTDL